MAFRKLVKLTVFTTKTALGAGTVLYFYESGLWKGSDETIKNYAKLQAEWDAAYKSFPPVIVKCVSEAKETVGSSTAPYTKAVTDFRHEWLPDLSFVCSGDGVIKPLWNSGVTWTIKTLANSPETIRNTSAAAWKKIGDMTSESSSDGKKTKL